jgi:ABC-type transport system substrate-binding protein
MEAVAGHWRVQPEFAALNLLKTPEVATAIAMVRTGIADIAGIPSRFRAEAEAANLHLTEAETAGEDFITFGGMFYAVEREGFGEGDPWVGSFDSKDPVGGENALKVRKALNLAVDRQAILDKILLGNGYLSAVSFAFQKEGAPWWNPDWVPYPYDPVLAKQLLTEAGYPNGFEINYWLTIQATSSRGIDEGEAVTSMWEQNLGLTVNREVVEYRPTVRSSLFDRTTTGYAFTWNNDVVTTPSIYGCGPGGPSTFAVVHWEHPMWDTMCAKLSVTVDPIEQAKLTRELGDFFYKNYVNVPLAYLNALFAVGPKVDFWKPRDLADAPTLLEYATGAS